MSTLLLTFMLATGGPATHESPDALFALANHALGRGAYAEAVAGYEKLRAAGIEDGHVYYNLGNGYLRQGRLGQAIAAYRNALSLLPRDEDVRANLAFARKQTKDAVAPPEPSPILRTIFRWHYAFNEDELGMAAALASALFWLALYFVKLGRGGAGIRLLAGAAGLVLLAAGPSFLLRQLAPERVAVVTAGAAEAHAAQDAGAVVRFVLREGAEVRVLARDGEWLRLALPDGQQGWVEASAVVVVEG